MSLLNKSDNASDRPIKSIITQPLFTVPQKNILSILHTSKWKQMNLVCTSGMIIHILDQYIWTNKFSDLVSVLIEDVHLDYLEKSVETRYVKNYIKKTGRRAWNCWSTCRHIFLPLPTIISEEERTMRKENIQHYGSNISTNMNSKMIDRRCQESNNGLLYI